MYVYDIVAIILIGISHAYLYLQLIQYKRLSWKLLTAISVIFTVILGTIVTVTGYPEFNALLLLTFLLSLGLLQHKHGLTFSESLFFALVSSVSITFVRMFLIEISFQLFMLSPLNLYMWTGSVLHVISAIIIFVSLILWRKRIVKAFRYMAESSFYYVTYSLLIISWFIMLVLTLPTTSLLSHLNTTYGQVSYISLIIVFLLLLMIFLVSSHLARERLLEEQQEKLDLEMLDYIEKLEVMHDELASFRHDYMNLLLSLNDGVRTKNMELIEHIYEDVISPTSEVINDKELELVKLSHVKIPEVKSVLSVKVIDAQQRGITVSLDIPGQISTLAMPIIPFIRAISILLDNAIEEAEKSKKRHIDLAYFQMEHTQLFIMQNTHSDEPIDLQAIFEKNYSHKGDGRGYGLFSLKRLIDQFPQATLETEFNDSYFKQTLSLTLDTVHEHK